MIKDSLVCPVHRGLKMVIFSLALGQNFNPKTLQIHLGGTLTQLPSVAWTNSVLGGVSLDPGSSSKSMKG